MSCASVGYRYACQAKTQLAQLYLSYLRFFDEQSGEFGELLASKLLGLPPWSYSRGHRQQLRAACGIGGKVEHVGGHRGCCQGILCQLGP